MSQKYAILFTFFIFSFAHGQIIDIPDQVFKATLLQANTDNGIAIGEDFSLLKIDMNNDGEIQVNEALNVHHLYIDRFQLTNLTGIEGFTNLKSLSCGYNSITSLNVTTLVNLEELYCESNEISELNLSNLLNLRRVTCENNQITTLDLTENNQLAFISCNNNRLTALNLAPQNQILYGLVCNDNYLTILQLNNLNALNYIYAERNNLQYLDVTGSTNISTLRLSDNFLETIDLSGNPNLLNIIINNNRLTSIDVSHSRYIASLELSGNLLTSVDISHTPTISTFILRNNPNLKTIFMKNGSRDRPELANSPNIRYICADEIELDEMHSWYQAIETNTYCTFNPGSNFYTITGTTKFDEGNNGCGLTDIGMPNVKLGITNGANSGSFFVKNDGSYNIPVNSGTHTLTPIFENPDYFSSSTATVSFPSAVNPSIQNFCITPIGTRPDLEVFINPNTAIPGFNSVYKIIYKNKGNVTQTGTVTFEFDDAVSDFISATPANVTQVTNLITWNFSNLKPFETREITVVLKLNAPTATPPINANDVLHFKASIDAGADEMPEDNIFEIDQMVFNSFDPNDITCLEGVTIGPQHIGKYLHYKIRFENTGTFAAKNIVIKDMIDLSKFDITTLISMSGSHAYRTKVDNTGKTEFIFENINLPFDDANNDGYVIFKIKTKSNLVVGDSFSNQANIYFDYNFPIITNNATTNIAALAATDFAFSDYFTLYPNPAGEKLNIKTSKDIKIASLSFYDVSGRLIQSISNPEMFSGIDVSSLNTGNYFIKINSDKGSTNAKFAKK